MRYAGLVMSAALVLSAAGCPKKEVVDPTPTNEVTVDGLQVTIEMPKRDYQVGEEFLVVVTAANTTGRSIKIVSRTGAPVYLRIWRHTGLDWEEVKAYPEAATMLMTTWTLNKKSARRFALPLTVEPDWPAGEILAVSAELNGREDVSPRLTFLVASTLE